MNFPSKYLTLTSPKSNFAVDFIASSSGVAVEKQAPLQTLPDPTTNLPGDEIKPLSGNPYFDVVISKSHIHHHCIMVISYLVLWTHMLFHLPLI